MSGQKKRSTKPSENAKALAARRDEIIRDWIVIYAAHYGREIDENDAYAYRVGLEDVHPDDLKPAFVKAMKEHRDRDGNAAVPKAADVLKYVVPTSHDAASRHYVIAGDGYCYHGKSSLDPNQHCGCRNCAPHLYCHHPGCEKVTMLDFRSASGRRFRWCADHMREHEDSRLLEPKAQFKSQLQKLADSKTMPGS